MFQQLWRSSRAKGFGSLALTKKAIDYGPISITLVRLHWSLEASIEGSDVLSASIAMWLFAFPCWEKSAR
jgi:hypothetical protein